MPEIKEMIIKAVDTIGAGKSGTDRKNVPAGNDDLYMDKAPSHEENQDNL